MQSSQARTNPADANEDIKVNDDINANLENPQTISDTAKKNGFASRINKLPLPKVVKNAMTLWGKPLDEIINEPLPLDEAMKDELAFIKNPTFDGFIALEKEFNDTYLIVGHPKYDWVNEVSVPTDEENSNFPLPYVPKSRNQEKWHKKSDADFESKRQETKQHTEKRHQKIDEKGLGYGGKMSTVVGKSKASAFFAKNNFTIRGNMFKYADKISPKNLYEIMPRYGYRKTAHVGVRTVQFTVNAIVASLGLGLIPVTLGLSEIISRHINNGITISGELITRKIAGAGTKKLTTHAGLRGTQLEVPLFIPVVGEFLYYGDYAALGVAAAGIVSTTIADAIYSKCFARYKATINLDDLGNARCLSELNKRIDYLSRFLIPYGEYILSKETDPTKRKVLKTIIKKKFKKLEELEQKKMRSLCYYLLSLGAEAIPDPQREIIQNACEKDRASGDTEKHINTHIAAKSCSAYLIAHSPNNIAKSQPKFYRSGSSFTVFSAAHLDFLEPKPNQDLPPGLCSQLNVKCM